MRHPIEEKNTKSKKKSKYKLFNLILTLFLQPQADEEQMGDIISLVDSIQEDYLPPIPLRYKKMPPEPIEPKMSESKHTPLLIYT